MGLLVDLRGQRQGHRFWKRKLDVASKVTDPASVAAWPLTPSLSNPQASAEKHFQLAAAKHREPHLFGASASAEPPLHETVPHAPQKNDDREKERLRERQRRYKQQLDEQVKTVLNRRLQEKKVEGNGYDGGIFRRLGEHVVHGGNQSPGDLHRKMLEDLDEQIRLKEARLIAEYDAGQKQDAKIHTESFWHPELEQDVDWDSPRRFNHRSLLAWSSEKTANNDRHPPWAIDDVMTPRPRLDNKLSSRESGLYQPAADKSYQKSSRPLFSESSERLDKILMDFLNEPIQL